MSPNLQLLCPGLSLCQAQGQLQAWGHFRQKEKQSQHEARGPLWVCPVVVMLLIGAVLLIPTQSSLPACRGDGAHPPSPCPPAKTETKPNPCWADGKGALKAGHLGRGLERTGQPCCLAPKLIISCLGKSCDGR